jgi:DNA-binding transcriptional MerR regulator
VAPGDVPGCVLYFGLDTVPDTPVEIPNRAAFRASEVCEIAQIPPYVLRSWEKEFPGLGATARPGGPRIYRRTDIEQILRIKQLVFAEGLTLSGVRRKIEGDPPPEDDPILTAVFVPDEVRSRVAHARRELRSLLDMLAEAPARAGQEPSGGTRAGESAPPVPGWPPPDRGALPEADQAGKADLPLLDGVLDTAPKARHGRRHAKQAHGGEASKVE